MKITAETVVRAKLSDVWDAWNNPADIQETFDAETENPPELQRMGWQAILDNFGRHVEAKARAGG